MNDPQKPERIDLSFGETMIVGFGLIVVGLFAYLAIRGVIVVEKELDDYCRTRRMQLWSSEK